MFGKIEQLLTPDAAWNIQAENVKIFNIYAFDPLVPSRSDTPSIPSNEHARQWPRRDIPSDSTSSSPGTPRYASLGDFRMDVSGGRELWERLAAETREISQQANSALTHGQSATSSPSRAAHSGDDGQAGLNGQPSFDGEIGLNDDNEALYARFGDNAADIMSNAFDVAMDLTRDWAADSSRYPSGGESGSFTAGSSELDAYGDNDAASLNFC